MNDVTTSDVISWVLATTVKEGKLEEFKGLCDEMVAATKDEEGALAYEWFVSADETQVHIYERYADSAAVMAHMGSFGGKFAQRFFGCVDPIGMWVYGDPNDEARGALSGAGATFLGPMAGFAR